MKTSVMRVPVLIAGAGAVGLAASDLLARYGVSSLLVEKRREVFPYPKARNLSFRSLEILRALGLSDRVHAVADGVSGMVVKPTLNSADEAGWSRCCSPTRAGGGARFATRRSWCRSSRTTPA
jgi:2-polyprenyl-6-methoxyphenol hydroxylase-like FAD-dependent oxidoreductase